MDRPWTTHYPPNVPASIDATGIESMRDVLEASFKQFADRPFSVCMDQWMSYKELDQRSLAFAAWLQHLGLKPGARIGIMLPNVPQFAVVMAGILRAGYVCVNINPLYTSRELEHQLCDSGCTVLIILQNFAHTLSSVVPRTMLESIVLTSIGDLLGPIKGGWINFAVKYLAKMIPDFTLDQPNALGQLPLVAHFKNTLTDGATLEFKRPLIQSESFAFLQYTGGTTGVSKGAILTHKNIVCATLQAQHWFMPAVEGKVDTSQVNSIAALPLYHIFALTLCFFTIRTGSFITLIPNPRDIKKFVAVLAKRPFHIFPAVNTLFNALLQNEAFRTIDFKALCLTQAGGMAASESTAKAWKDLTGSTMIEGWGMSETCAIGSNNPINLSQFSGNIGLPLPGIDMVIKSDDGQTLGVGLTGEICIKGPNVMKGYFNQPLETQKAFTEDGFLKTGDIGIQDANGFFKLLDRKKDMILVSGFNVFPSEIESVAASCPGVLECAAVSIPDSKQGEAIKLYVVKKEPSLTSESVIAFCKTELTAYKVPKVIEFKDTLPKSNVGKILRRELRNA
jgi:long-chain acyl-CoA synthetase